MTFHDCYMKCRAEFLVNSDFALGAHLTEFYDHKLVRSRKGTDGVEHLLILVDKEILSKYMEKSNKMKVIVK